VTDPLPVLDWEVKEGGQRAEVFLQALDRLRIAIRPLASEVLSTCLGNGDRFVTGSELAVIVDGADRLLGVGLVALGYVVQGVDRAMCVVRMSAYCL